MDFSGNSRINGDVQYTAIFWGVYRVYPIDFTAPRSGHEQQMQEVVKRRADLKSWSKWNEVQPTWVQPMAKKTQWFIILYEGNTRYTNGLSSFPTWDIP